MNFNSFYVVSNAVISDVIGDVPVKEYFTKINEMIVSTFHMINVFQHSESEMDTFTEPDETARLLTVGVLGVEDGKEKMFFNLTNPREKRYYYAIPETILESDGKLMKKVSQQLKENKDHDKMKMDYGIYTTKYEQPYVYCVAASSKIQKKNT